MGIVVDPDVDRLAFVCEDGNVFGEEYTLVAVADHILSFKKEVQTIFQDPFENENDAIIQLRNFSDFYSLSETCVQRMSKIT